MLRAIPDTLDPAIVGAIDARLDGVESEHRATIAIAIESGSRAWGFPSPDSDYDCRFIYVRREYDYLSPWVRRDVIETPLDSIFDVNGWDLGKVLKLMLKGNAVAIEWLMSPIVYRADAGLRNDLLAFADRFVERARIVNHYRRLGERQRRTYFADGKDIALKKLFYALRPAAALRWFRLHPDAKIAPMHFPTLMAQCEPPQEIAALVDDLIVRKAVTRELGNAPLPLEIDRFIEHEFELAAASDPGGSWSPSEEARIEAEVVFRRWVHSLDAARP